MVVEAVPDAAGEAVHIKQRLATLAALRAGHAGVVVNISGVAFKAGEAEIVFIAVEASNLAEVVELGKIDVIVDILELKLDEAGSFNQFVPQRAGNAGCALKTEDAVWSQAGLATAR